MCGKTAEFHGESGGPLMCSFNKESPVLVGINSFGSSRISNGVYVPLSKYFRWIKDQIKQHESVPYDPDFVCDDAACAN